MSASTPYEVVYYSAEAYRIAQTTSMITLTYPVVLAVVVWDWLTSLPAEYTRVWRRELNLVSFFYAGSRYYTIFCIAWLTVMYTSPTHSWDLCQKTYKWSCGLTIPIELFSGGVLLLRTYAFTGRKVWILALSLVMYVAMLAFMVYIAAVGVELVPWTIVGAERGACITAGKPDTHITIGFWVAPLAYSAILTGITLVHSYRLQKQGAKAERSPLLKSFLRDGLAYFAVVTCTNILNVAFFAQQDPAIQGSAMAFQFALSSLMSCRLILSLRSDEAHVTHRAPSTPLRSVWGSGLSRPRTSASEYERRERSAGADTLEPRQPEKPQPIPIYITREAVTHSEKDPDPLSLDMEKGELGRADMEAVNGKY